MKNEFIPYEQALALKGLGFGERCMALYNEEGKTIHFSLNLVNKKPYFSAPLYQQAFRWFRVRHGLNHFVEPDVDCGPNYYNAYVLCSLVYHGNNYEEAELACLKKLIELSTKTA